MRIVLRIGLRTASALTALLLLSAGLVFSQQSEVMGLTDFPVPAWPKDGVFPASLKENYVFIDTDKNEYVLAYPENLGSETFAKDGPGKLKISRFELLRDVTPDVRVTITAADDHSKFKYAYSVANGNTAHQSIDVWLLALPDSAAHDSIVAPDGWFGIVQNGRKFKLKNPEWIRNGAAAIWSFQKIDQFIQPGSSRQGFELQSALRPGFTVAYFRKSESVDVKVATHGNIPKEVKDQMDQLLQLEYNSRTILTIGPKFAASADDHVIAEDYIQGIISLSRAGVLNLSSDFVRNLMNELTAVKPGAPAAIHFASAPQTPVETDLASALKAALRMN